MKRVAIFLFSLLLASPLAARTYTTGFPLTQNPISEGSSWINGYVETGQFGNVQTSTDFAYGTEMTAQYTDAIAVVSGSWGPTQTVTGTVSTNSPSSACCHEVELHVRMTLAANSGTGYEITCSVSSGDKYLQIVAWDGAAGTYHYVNESDSTDYCPNNTTLMVTVVGSTFNVYLNGSLKITATDTTYISGAPGIGFYSSNVGNPDIYNYGFSYFSATDGLGPSLTKGVMNGLISLFHLSAWYDFLMS